MARGNDPTEEEFMRNEITTLKASLSTETDRCAQLSAEILRLHVALGRASSTLNETSVMCSTVNQIKRERDLFKKQLDDQLQFRRAPLEAQLADANRILFEQRLQFRSIVDVLASQRDWVREWALQCQENMRLQDVLAKRDAGTEVSELQRRLLESNTKLAEVAIEIKHRDASIAVSESKARFLELENNRLKAESNLLKEQNKRMWKRLAGGGKAVAKSARVGDGCD